MLPVEKLASLAALSVALYCIIASLSLRAQLQVHHRLLRACCSLQSSLLCCFDPCSFLEQVLADSVMNTLGSYRAVSSPEVDLTLDTGSSNHKKAIATGPPVVWLGSSACRSIHQSPQSFADQLVSFARAGGDASHHRSVNACIPGSPCRLRKREEPDGAATAAGTVWQQPAAHGVGQQDHCQPHHGLHNPGVYPRPRILWSLRIQCIIYDPTDDLL